jgi:hypothetical protein
MKRVIIVLFLTIICFHKSDAQRRTIAVDGTAYHTFGPNRSLWGFDRVLIEGGTGITWLKITSTGAGRGRAWEAAPNVIFDGVPFGGLEIICPKSPPPCQGCGPVRVQQLHFFIWGQGELRVNVTQVTYDNDNITEGQFLNREDPDGRIYGMGSVTLDPPNVQAGNEVNIQVLVPSRMLAHVGRVDLILPAPTPQNIYGKNRITLPFDPDGIYDFTWIVPDEYYGQSNVWDVNASIRFEIYSNKENANGQVPRLTTGSTILKVAGVLTARLVVQGKTVPNGGATEWISNRELRVSAQAMHGRGPYTCVWTINGQDYPGTGSDYRTWEFKDQNVLRTANIITAVITDANGNSSSSTITVGVKTDMYVEMVVQGRDVPVGGSINWKKDGYRRVIARIKRGERPINYRWIINNGAYETPLREADPQVSFENQDYLGDSLTITIEAIDANNVMVRGTITIGMDPKDKKEEEPEPTGPVGPPPVPPPLTGDPSMGANPSVDWDNRPWLDERVQACAREYLQNIVLYMANERRKWENTGRSESKQQPLFTSIDDWGRVLNQYMSTSGGVDGNWDNPTHFVWSEFNKPAAQNLCGRTVEYYVKYECNSLRPTEDDLQAAINDLTEDGLGDPCLEDSIQKELLTINNGRMLSQSYYSGFIQYYDKIIKEINDQKSDPSRNDLIAYSYVSATNQITFHTGNQEEVKEVGNKLITRAGQCPDDVDMFGIIQILSEVNNRQEDMLTKMEEINTLLESFGVDIQETIQQGNQIAQQNADPNWVQDGGVGVELIGDGIDNLSTGIQDQMTNAASQGAVVIVIFDCGDVQDDVFSLIVDGRNRGDTDPGDYRIYTLDDLAPGEHEAVIIGRKTDVGACTYGIIIREGMNELVREADIVEVNTETPPYVFWVSGI